MHEGPILKACFNCESLVHEVGDADNPVPRFGCEQCGALWVYQEGQKPMWINLNAKEHEKDRSETKR